MSDDKSGILQFIDEKKKNDELVFPISSSHIIELAKHSNIERRRRLAETMWNFSNGLVLVNQTEILNFEIDTAIESLFGIEKKVKSFDLFCTNPIRGLAPLEEVASLLTVSAKNIKTCSELFEERDEWVSFVSSCYDENRKIDLDQIHQYIKSVTSSINKNRSALNEESDELKRRAIIAMLIHDTQDRVSERLRKFYLDMNDIMGLGMEKITSFYLSIPSFDIEVEMKMQSFKNKGKVSVENDVFDIGFLTTAIHYFDVVITEKYWANITKQSKLNIKYNTLIETDLLFLRAF